MLCLHLAFVYRRLLISDVSVVTSQLVNPPSCLVFSLFVRMLSLLFIQSEVWFERSAVFVCGFLWARLQTGGWETVTSTNSHSRNPPGLQLFQHPPAFLLPTKQRNVQDLSALPFYSQLLLTQMHYTRDSIFHRSHTSIKHGLGDFWIIDFLSFFLPLIFQAHRCTECIWSLSVASRSAFLCHAASAQENAYGRVKFLMQECSARSSFSCCPCLALFLDVRIFTNWLGDTGVLKVNAVMTLVRVFLMVGQAATFNYLWLFKMPSVESLFLATVHVCHSFAVKPIKIPKKCSHLQRIK